MYSISKYELIEQCAGTCAEAFKSSIEFMVDCMFTRDNCLTNQWTNNACEQLIWRQKMYGGCPEPVSECVPREIEQKIAAELGPYIFLTYTAAIIAGVGYLAYEYIKDRRQNILVLNSSIHKTDDTGTGSLQFNNEAIKRPNY